MGNLLFVVVRGTRVYVCAYGNQKTMPVSASQAPSVEYVASH